ncbi:hypothetical protein OQH61_02650 [Helicobacter sp. MIT 21-1697]|uniref:hypothetical protein n=1 Tax=Helicobacter sp. MIT 21-1697 TaxID=2993733 RepID=UPI00224AEC4F|nr:hypothetical protein [Helicobacter sp. MIT 21-1697]MCX2716631.1 hypothetical protein [Helicobacter sp. MIT 21-1697]
MKHLFLPLLFICSIISILCVGFYPYLSLLFYPAFFGIFVVLFAYSYEVLKVRKQATIKAYYKRDSFLYRYFGHFFLTKIVSLVIALVGSVSLFFMLVFPSGSEILIFCLLVPCSVYGFRLVYLICNANLSPDFAPILAKKYTALITAFLALMCEVALNNFAPIVLESNDIHAHYLVLMENYNIAQMHSHFWQELFGFILLKKALLDVLYFSIADSYLHFALILLFACGHFASFASFSLMCVGGIVPKTHLEQKSKNEQDTPTIIESRAFKQFFAMVFFLIFIYIAFNVSIHLQPLAKHHHLPPLLSEQILKENESYIQISMQGAQSLIRSNDLPSLEYKIKENLAFFESHLNTDTEKIVNEYLAHKERIIDEYSKWYFSVRGEYTRLFYAAIGKGEDIAQEQFIFLLKAHTPYDLQEHLNNMYDTHIENLKSRLKQSFGFFTTHKKPSNAAISLTLSLEDINAQINSLSPRATDGVAALLGASVVGAMILKSSGKAVAKSTAKAVSKSVAKKGLSGAVGAGGSIVCGMFAPLCAIGFFVASDYAINTIDEALNQDEFKRQMREGFDLWELQLKNSLISYNSQLSKQILEKLSLQDDSYRESAPKESKE